MYKPETPYTLVGVDGNVFALIGYTKRAMRRCGYSPDEIDAFYKRATSADYYNAVAECSDMIDSVNAKCGFE